MNTNIIRVADFAVFIAAIVCVSLWMPEHPLWHQVVVVFLIAATSIVGQLRGMYA